MVSMRIQLSDFMVSNLTNFVGSTNIFSINLYREIEELIEYGSGMVTSLGSQRSPLRTNYHICLTARSLTRFDLPQLLSDKEVPHGRILGQRIDQIVNDSLANDTSLRQPLFVAVNVIYIEESRVRVENFFCAMEILRPIRVSTGVSNLRQIVGMPNIVSINLDEEIQELIEFESGRASLSSQRSRNSEILLEPCSFTEPALSQLLYEQEVPHAQELGQRIAHVVKDALDNDKNLRQPLLVLVNAAFIRERRYIIPRIIDPRPLLLRGASRQVLKRMVEEQRVKSADLEKEDETCSICIKNFSESHENIIRMPDCLHMFHLDCLLTWLCRQNSCPLCRKVPYQEEG